MLACPDPEAAVVIIMQWWDIVKKMNIAEKIYVVHVHTVMQLRMKTFPTSRHFPKPLAQQRKYITFCPVLRLLKTIMKTFKSSATEKEEYHTHTIICTSP